MSHQRPLSDFPDLHAWYQKACKTTGRSVDLSDYLALQTCGVLASNPNEMTIKKWITTLTEVFAASVDLRRDFLYVVSHFHENRADFAEILGDLTHVAVTFELGEILLPALQLGAEKSNIAALRFLAAWTALNCNRPEICINECEKVDEPFAPLNSILGQAYLESGRLSEALEALNVAIALAPGDAVAWFQKAKTLHILNRPLEAFECLLECENLAPNSAEIALMMTFVVLDSELKSEMKEYAWKKLRLHLDSLGHISQVPIHLLRLSLQLRDKTRTLDVAEAWQKRATLRNTEDLQGLAQILRELQALDWMDIAQKLLEKVVIHDASYGSRIEPPETQKSLEKVSE
jgi:tetratricopeptide (TPR) repeat protein